MPRPNKVLVQQLSQQQNNKCIFCKCDMKYHNGEAHLHPRAMTREHVIPRSHGGTDEESNYVVSCNRCNSLRGTIDFTFFTIIVAKLLKEDVCKEHWHSPYRSVQKRLRKAIQLEVMQGHAVVCRRAAFKPY
jgi:5-methylcytosine-specific restriction endonuclease McrA